MTPLISIVVPVYNTAPFLRRCLDSIVAQTFRDIKIICVNDGSTDNSAAILNQYQAIDDRISVVEQINGGRARVRNKGLSLVETEWVAFVDSDDYIEPTTYEVAAAHLTSDIDLLCFGIIAHGAKTIELQESDENYYKIKYKGKVAITPDLLKNTDASACNKIFRTAVIRKRKIQCPPGLAYEDAYLFSAFAMCARAAFFIPQKFYHYIRHESGSIMSATFSGKSGISEQHVEIGIELYKFIEQENLFQQFGQVWCELFESWIEFALRFTSAPNQRSRIIDNALTFLRQCYKKHCDCIEIHQLIHRLSHEEAPRRVKWELFGIRLGLIVVKRRKKYWKLFGKILVWEKRLSPSP